MERGTLIPLRLQVADVNLFITCRDSVLLQGLDPVYQSFLGGAGRASGSIDVEVRLELQSGPSTEGLREVFDSGASWSLFRDHGAQYLKWHPPAFEEPLWLARFDDHQERVTVYCGDTLLSRRDGRTALSSPVRYPLDQLLLMYVLARKDGALIHAAGAAIKGEGFVFPGRSGAGKTTLSRELVARADVEPLSDDRIVVRRMDGQFRAFGTPWPGEADIANNKSAPLSGIFFLAHGAKNVISKIDKREALERLLPVTSVPWYDRDVVPGLLTFLEGLVSAVPSFELQFRPGPDAADALLQFAPNLLVSAGVGYAQV